MVEFLRDREAFSHLANKAGLITRDNWYEIDNSADDEAVIYVYSEIGYFGATAEEFVAELKEITAEKITIRINSLGGSIFETIGIFNALRSHPAEITTQVDAVAASAASVIVQAGDNRVMLDNSEMMIHEATGIAVGATATDMRELANVVDNQTNKIAEIYAKRKGDGRSKNHFLTLMRAGASNMGTWFSAKETITEGLADEVVTPKGKTENKVPEPVGDPLVPTDFSDLFNTDPEDFEWSTPKETLV
jgi:ATP-dependent protease ClpP protease subunit